MYRWDDLSPVELKEANEHTKTNNQTLKYLKKYFPIIFNARTGRIFLIHQKDNAILKSNGFEFDKADIVSHNFEELLEKIMNKEIEL
jgi:carbonic anhydrase